MAVGGLDVNMHVVCMYEYMYVGLYTSITVYLYIYTCVYIERDMHMYEAATIKFRLYQACA